MTETQRHYSAAVYYMHRAVEHLDQVREGSVPEYLAESLRAMANLVHELGQVAPYDSA